MKLVKLDNYEIKVEDELLLLKPFNIVYKADKTSNKSKFYDFMTILYFTYDPRSDFNYITNEKLRLKEVCESNGFKVPKFNNNEQECIKLYQKLTETSASILLERTRIAVDKLGKFLEQIDLTEEDDKGKPKYTVNSVVTAIKQVPQLAKDVMEAEKAVAKEIEEQGRARGSQGTKKLMDDGILTI